MIELGTEPEMGWPTTLVVEGFHHERDKWVKLYHTPFFLVALT